MSPAFFATVASRLFAHRWWLLACSAANLAGLLALLVLGSRLGASVAGVLAGPLIAVPWALFCACAWFHPEHGNLQPANKMVGKLPRLLQSAVRWYAALFLALFLVIAALLWPVLALSGL